MRLSSEVMDISTFLRGSYLAAASIIIAVKCIPLFADRLLAYGSRASVATGKESKAKPAKKAAYPRKLINWVDTLASLRVPHSWFASFYVASTSLAIFWAQQLLFRGSFFQYLATCSGTGGPSMTLSQVIVAWAMMLVQSSRRLYESIENARPSSAQMWIGHWVLGILFYTGMSVAVWVEGIPALLSQDFTPRHFYFAPPTPRTFVATLLFLLASGVQHDCHAYLASLKKYTLPDHPAFQSLVCPHYLAECLIYLSLSIVAAPPGRLLNGTIMCALIFVGVNLGVTADGTRRWYQEKFGNKSVALRWRMIPFVF